MRSLFCLCLSLCLYPSHSLKPLLGNGWVVVFYSKRLDVQPLRNVYSIIVQCNDSIYHDIYLMMTL